MKGEFYILATVIMIIFLVIFFSYFQTWKIKPTYPSLEELKRNLKELPNSALRFWKDWECKRRIRIKYEGEMTNFKKIKVDLPDDAILNFSFSHGVDYILLDEKRKILELLIWKRSGFKDLDEIYFDCKVDKRKDFIKSTNEWVKAFSYKLYSNGWIVYKGKKDLKIELDGYELKDGYLFAFINSTYDYYLFPYYIQVVGNPNITVNSTSYPTIIYEGGSSGCDNLTISSRWIFFQSEHNFSVLFSSKKTINVHCDGSFWYIEGEDPTIYLEEKNASLAWSELFNFTYSYAFEENQVDELEEFWNVKIESIEMDGKTLVGVDFPIVYGNCSFFPAEGRHFGFINEKNGIVENRFYTFNLSNLSVKTTKDLGEGWMTCNDSSCTHEMDEKIWFEWSSLIAVNYTNQIANYTFFFIPDSPLIKVEVRWNPFDGSLKVGPCWNGNESLILKGTWIYVDLGNFSMLSQRWNLSSNEFEKDKCSTLIFDGNDGFAYFYLSLYPSDLLFFQAEDGYWEVKRPKFQVFVERKDFKGRIKV